SLAGLRAAEQLRSAGHDGRLVVIGAEDALPYDRPPLSKQVLTGEWLPERAALVRRPDAETGIEWWLGRRASGLDVPAREITLDGGERLAFEGLVIATGASPRRLPTGGLAGILTLRTLDDCLAIGALLEQRPRVVVVGAGFIGAEVAAACRHRGLEVTVLEAL